MGGINIFILAPSSQAIRPGRDECTFNLGALRIISEGLKNIIFDFLSFPAGCPLYILEIITNIIYTILASLTLSPAEGGRRERGGRTSGNSG